ncbi:MAG: ABC transporter permease [Lentimicrobiaceae bacterium]|nr:ABC transporter permease [Lentimicrobiaceae bacterium]
MRTLKYLIQKEFKQIIRDRTMPLLITLYPLMTMILFPWAINFEVKNIKVNVIDYSKGAYSQRIISKIDASKYFILKEVSPSYKSSMDDFKKGDCNIIIEIPADFDKNLIKNKNAQLMISVNSVDGTQGLLGNNYLVRILNNFSNEIRKEKGLLELNTNKINPHIDITTNYSYNPDLNYKTYMIPAFFVLLVTLIVGMLPTLNIVGEKEKGTIRQINVTPINRYTFILGKLIPHWIIGFIILFISMVIGWLMYGLFPAGSIFAIFIASTIFIIGISGMGIIVSNYSSTLQQAVFTFLFFILVIILLSGLFSSIDGMPVWAKVIAFSNPLTYYIDIMRRVYLVGSSTLDVLPAIGILGLFCILLNAWAFLSYKKVSD